MMLNRLRYIIGLYKKNGAPEEIRTPDPRFRKPLLYPTELRAHFYMTTYIINLIFKKEFFTKNKNS